LWLTTRGSTPALGRGLGKAIIRYLVDSSRGHKKIILYAGLLSQEL
jgi:hypothetical protein